MGSGGTDVVHSATPSSEQLLPEGSALQQCLRQEQDGALRAAALVWLQKLLGLTLELPGVPLPAPLERLIANAWLL